ncbi:MAG: glycosyltransferase, partial [Lachnospiraceae bacterium]|nr:glycosyltransferase [Lachnospiraceae bacterium]
MCKVSVVIPIYNTAKYLDRCIKSVINQTLKEIEIILVDDGSKDEAPSMCDEWAKKDARIEVIHKENGGLGFARNSGLEAASGEFVAFLDSDDFVEKDMYETLYNAAKEHKVDTCLCGHKKYYDDGHYDERPNLKAGSLYLDKKVYKDVLLEVLGTLPEYPEDLTIGVSTCMGIYSVAVFKDNNIRFCSERQFISEDFMMNIDYYRYAKGVYILDTTPYNYCANGESLSKSSSLLRISLYIT